MLDQARNGRRLDDHETKRRTISGLAISHAYVLTGINSYAGRLHAVTFSTDGLRRAVQLDVPMDGHTDERIQLG
jgi:hypothetical protein